ncbi:MAG: hypothetical protein ACE5HO_18270 [bacterium]
MQWRPRAVAWSNLWLLAVIFSLVACEHRQGVAPQLGLAPTFSSIKANIFTPKCVNAGCHPGGGAPMSLQSGVAYENLVNVLSTGFAPLNRVEPNDAENSVLYLKILGDPRTGNRMPLGRTPLDSDLIEAVKNWINAGAENN